MGNDKPQKAEAPSQVGELAREARTNLCSEWLGTPETSQAAKGKSGSPEASAAAAAAEQYPPLPLTTTEKTRYGHEITRYRDEKDNKYEDKQYYSSHLSKRTITSADGNKTQVEFYSKDTDPTTGETCKRLQEIHNSFIDANGEETRFIREFDRAGQITHALLHNPDGTGTNEHFEGGMLVKGVSHKDRTRVAGKEVTTGEAKLAYDDKGLVRRNPNTGEFLYHFTGDYKGIYLQPSSTNAYNDKWYWPF